MDEDDVTVGELGDRVPRRTPGGEPHDAPHQGVSGGAEGGTRSHRVAEEHHRQLVARLLPQRVEGGHGVVEGVGAVAVPAPVAVPHLPYEHAAPGPGG